MTARRARHSGLKGSNQKRFLALALIGVGLALLLAYFLLMTDKDSTSQQPISRLMSGGQDAGPEPQFDKSAYSTSEPASPWVVVNKGRRLPSTYQPADLIVPKVTLRYASGSEMQLRAQAGEALVEMFTAAEKDGVKLMIASGYRNYGLQSSIYSRHVNQSGVANTDRVSARPGHSEHQTGWALDVAPASGKCVIEVCFGNLAEGKWVAANAHKYGFVVRYQEGRESLTGYSYEPWHIRFVGKELSAELAKDNLTLEQFFGLETFTSYPKSPYSLQ